MNAIWHDYSRRAELRMPAEVVADITVPAAAAQVEALITGAFARDLHHRGGLPVDIVPFGAVETPDRHIKWPPDRSLVMDVFGFREAMANAHSIQLPGAVTARLVSLPALAMLKLVCWQDRHYRAPRKDAHDIDLLLRRFLDAGNEMRLWDEFAAWMDEDDFDYEHSGPRMLGVDMGRLLDGGGRDRMAALLERQVDADAPGALPTEMEASNPDHARALLVALRRGLLDGAGST